MRLLWVLYLASKLAHCEIFVLYPWIVADWLQERAARGQHDVINRQFADLFLTTSLRPRYSFQKFSEPYKICHLLACQEIYLLVVRGFAFICYCSRSFKILLQLSMVLISPQQVIMLLGLVALSSSFSP